ncbi:MAG: hypothetical protein U0168_27470 [Nannocystaceae bacterium]
MAPAASATAAAATPPVDAEPLRTRTPTDGERGVASVPTTVPTGAALLQWPRDMHLSGGTSVVLFDDEKRALRRAVAKRLAKHGVAVVPLDLLERVEAAAARGQLALEDDTQCVTPPTRDEIHNRDFPTNPRVSIEASCLDACRLTVVVDPSGENPQYFESRTVSHPEDPAAWVAAAATLGDNLTGVGGLGIGGTSHAPPIRFDTPGWVGPWPAKTNAETLHAMFQALEPEATPCASVDPFVSLTWELRLRVDAHGRTARCSATSSDPAASSPAAQCLCDVMARASFGKGSSKRRLRLDAIDEGGFASPGVEFSQRQPGTEPWVERVRRSGATVTCAQTAAPPAGLDATLAMTLAPSGRIDDVRIDGDIREIAAMQWAQCMVDQLRTLQLPCAPPGIEILRMRLRVPSP